MTAEEEGLLSELSQLTGVELRLTDGGAAPPDGWTAEPVSGGGEPTGRVVQARGTGRLERLVARLAAEILGRRLAGQGALLSRPLHEHRLKFLYETSRQVGGLVDEQKICEFVVKQAAELLGCKRASIMLLDPNSGLLKIRASIGLPKEVVEQVAVKPGERISGEVFATGRQRIVGRDEPLPAGSLGLEEPGASAAFLSVPLTTPDFDGTGEQRIVGVINLTRKARGGGFTPSDVRLVQTLAAHTAAQVNTCRLIAAERERRRLVQELEIAARIQLRLLPEKPLRTPGFTVAGLCRPAERIGGDFFDYWKQGERVCLLVADVTGHDLAAALLATALRSVVRAESAHRGSIAQMLGDINRVLYGDLTRAEMQITVCYLEVDLRKKLLSYSCCGHPYPLLLQDSRPTWLQSGGMLLGVTEDADFEEESIPLSAGDTFVVYTDGVLEAGTPARAPFGMDGLLSAAMKARELPPVKLVGHLVNAVQKHAQPGKLNDDVTVLVGRMGGE